MFEQSVLEARSLAARPWTLAVSLAGQSLLISTAIVLPLLHPDVLQRASYWMPVVSPPHSYRQAAPVKLEAARPVAVHRAMNLNGLFAPVKVPTEIHIFQDPPPEIGGFASGPPDGVVGGIPFTGPESAIVRNLSQEMAPTPPVPARPVVKETAKAVQTIQRLKIGGDVQEARLLSARRPVYPVLARQARIQGTVRLAALIGPDGRIAGLHVTSGHPLLVSAAMDAVKQWVYRPTMLNGDPVEVVTEISVMFTLQ